MLMSIEGGMNIPIQRNPQNINKDKKRNYHMSILSVYMNSLMIHPY